jgi:hypothetical protein
MQHRFIVDNGARAARLGMSLLKLCAPRFAKKLPKPAARSFSSWWRNNHEQ